MENIKILDLFDKVIKNEETEGPVCTWEIADEVGVCDPIDIFDTCLLKSYWVSYQNREGGYVGCKVFFLEGEPAFITLKEERKSDTRYKWVSSEMYYKVQSYILSLVDAPEFELIGDEETIPTSYKLPYAGAALPSHRLELNGETFTRDNFATGKIQLPFLKDFYTIHVKDSRGNRKAMDVRDFTIHINIKQEEKL